MAELEYPLLLGRREILTDSEVITADNLLDELSCALVIHRENRSQIQYLWDYYRGKQDIQNKVKQIREEINSKITVNRANEIVMWKRDYLTGEPITYIAIKDDDAVRENVNKLNEAMNAIDKLSQDQELVLWDMVCGTAYRYISTEKIDEDIPFNTYTLDPRNSFVVYSSKIERKPMFSVMYHDKVGNVVNAPMVGANIYQSEVYEIYTDTMYFKVEDGNITIAKPHYLGEIPVIEYPANKERQGAFEVVIPLLNCLNELYSARLDGTKQFVQAFMKFVNCDVDDNALALLKEYGAIKIKSEPGVNADVDLVTSELNQDQAETFVDSVNAQINVICALPNRNGGSSTSDTGRAVELRDGFISAEMSAKGSETQYKRADKKALRIIFKICKIAGYCDLKVKDVDSKFTRRNYENMQSKSQVLIAMLQNNKIHPKLAFVSSGMFTDPEEAYQMSMDYYDEQQKLLLTQQANAGNTDSKEQGSSKNANSEDGEMSNPILKSASQTNH